MFTLDPRTKETIILVISSLFVTFCVVFLIIVIFLLSGNQELLNQMLQNTAEGEILNILITTTGPFGIWVSTFLLIRFVKIRTKIKSYQVVLNFKDLQSQNVPSNQLHFTQSTCWYSVFSNGHEALSNKSASIRFTSVGLAGDSKPFITLDAPGVENPEFQVYLKFKNRTFVSDSWSPRKGDVLLQ